MTLRNKSTLPAPIPFIAPTHFECLHATWLDLVCYFLGLALGAAPRWFLRTGSRKARLPIPSRMETPETTTADTATCGGLPQTGTTIRRLMSRTAAFPRGAPGGILSPSFLLFNLVVVHRVDTDDPAKKVTLEQFGELLRLILSAS